MALNAENGRLAQIVFDNPERISTAAISDITGSLTAESVLTAAMIWLENLGRRRKRPVLDICIVCEQRQAKNAQKLHALLNKKWKAKMTNFEIDRKHDPPRLNPLPARQISSLWREKAQRLTLPKESETSKTAATIRDMAPGIIDVLYSRNGETLRFLGLPFARVRITPESERAWFGLGRDRHLLTESDVACVRNVDRRSDRIPSGRFEK